MRLNEVLKVLMFVNTLNHCSFSKGDRGEQGPKGFKGEVGLAGPAGVGSLVDTVRYTTKKSCILKTGVLKIFEKSYMVRRESLHSRNK